MPQVQALTHLNESSLPSFFLTDLWREQGGVSLFRGNITNIQRTIPVNWAKFTTFIHFKQVFFPNGMGYYSGRDQLIRHFFCGMSCVYIINLIAYPFDSARTRLVCDYSKLNENRMYTGTWQTFKTMFRNEGYISLYRGFWINNAFYAPFLALSFSFYEHIRSLFHPSVPLNKQPTQNIFFKLFGAGGIAAASASLLTYPLDTIRRRMMVNGGVGFEKIYSGAIDCAIKIAKKEGIRGFYSGFLANLVKIIPAFGLQFSVYDNTRMFIFE